MSASNWVPFLDYFIHAKMFLPFPILMAQSRLNTLVTIKLNSTLFVGDSKFASAEYRLFKVKSQNSKSSKATYKGGIPGAENQFVFDNQWKFKV